MHMKTKLLLTFLLLVPLLAADDPKPDAAKEELKKFAGTWKLLAADFEGEEQKPDDLKKVSLVVEGNEFTLKFGDETHKGKFTIGPAKKPKTIDAEFTEGSLSGNTVLGVYEMDGDTRKSCFSEPIQTKDRPTDFTGGKGKYVWTWKRDKPGLPHKAWL
jgi:uncharacterized protein (TIGR03067 family)